MESLATILNRLNQLPQRDLWVVVMRSETIFCWFRDRGDCWYVCSHTYHHQILLPEAGIEPTPSRQHGDFFGLGLRERQLTVCIVGHNQRPVKRIGPLYEVYLGWSVPIPQGTLALFLCSLFVYKATTRKTWQFYRDFICPCGYRELWF